MANEIFSSLTRMLPSMGSWEAIGYAAIAGAGFLVLLVVIIWLGWYRKQWNLKVEFKIPRGIGYLREGETIDITKVQGIVNSEWGKGSYDPKKGAVFVKRKGKKKVPLKPFDVKRYLQGRDNILTVVQVGIEDYRPVLPDSFIEMVDENTGEEAALLKIKIDTSESKAWKSQFEREAKSAYSIVNVLKENMPYIMVGLVIFLWGIQFLILYNRIKGA